MNKQKLEDHKDFVGSNFFHFYIQNSTVCSIWLGTALGALFFIWFMHQVIINKYITVQSMLNAVMVLFLFVGIPFSILAAMEHYTTAKEKNEFIKNVKNGDPVKLYLVRKYGFILDDCLEDKESMKLETTSGTIEYTNKH